MTARCLGVGATWMVGAASALLAIIGFTHESVATWTVVAPISALDLTYGLTPVALPFLSVLALVSFPVGLWSVRRARPVDIVLIAGFAAAMLGVLVARSIASFFLAWEIMSLISAFLVAAHHERRNVRRATLSYLIVAQSGAICVLLALGLLGLHAGSVSFSAIAAKAAVLPAHLRAGVFVLALVGFGSKAGLMPLHFWLPRAHPVAPANASAMLSGVMLKVALYGLFLMTLQLAAPAPISWGVTLMLLGALSAVGGVLYAIVDNDLKRLLAYSSVENIGIIVMGFGVALAAQALSNPTLAGLALTAAFFHTINHGVFKGLLFLGAGTVGDVEGTVALESLGGVWGTLAWTAPFFLVGCAAVSALPPFNGFASEWMTFQSLIAGLAESPLALRVVFIVVIAALALTSGLAAACFVKVFGIAFLGQSRRMRPAPAREAFDPASAGVGLFAVLCVLFGFVPALVVGPLSRIATNLFGAPPLLLPTLPLLPGLLIAFPVLGVVLAFTLARVRGVRSVPTWTCGSEVTVRAQYSATAFAKPLRMIFAFLLVPERRRVDQAGLSKWFPKKIVYHTTSRYLVDDVARWCLAVMLRFARRTRALQSGSLRLYLAYAVAAVIVVLVIVR